MGIETLLSVGGSLAGGLMQSDAAGDAADAQASATASSIAENRRQFDLTRSDYAPARNIGNNALRRIAALYGLDDGGATSGVSENEIRQLLTPQFTTGGTPAGYAPPANATYGPEGNNQNQTWQAGTPGTVNQAGLDTAVQQRMQEGQASTPRTYNDGLDDPIQMDPGYEFGLQQGQQALDRKIAASGGRVSGQALKAAQRFGTDYATTGYSAAYQRRQDRLNRLQALAGIGQTATSGSAQAGDAAAARNSALLSSQGDAAGAASIAQGNIWANTGNQIASAAKRWQTPGSSPADLSFGSATSNWW